MIDPFRLEAKYYDQIWGSADRYKSEAESLDQILKDHEVHRVLDLGCGTGGHCLELAKLSYDMVGVDISEAMLGKSPCSINWWARPYGRPSTLKTTNFG